MRHRLYIILIGAVLIFSLSACSFQNGKEEKKGEKYTDELTV